MTITRLRAVEGLAEPVGPFAHAVVTGGFVFTSGQLPTNVDGRQPTTFEEQVEAAIANLRTALEAAGSDFEHVVSVRTFLTDPAQLETYNRVYERHLGAHPPARTTVCATLWGVSLEIDCVARIAGERAGEA